MSQLFILGGTGFIGRRTVSAALAAGHNVRVLTRSPASAAVARQLGGQPVAGDAARPAEWIAQASGSDVIIDLTQPALPARLTRRAVDTLAAQRVTDTRALLEALTTVPAADRPVLLAASGTDDLQPDRSGALSANNPLRTTPRGFGHIGQAVRRTIEAHPAVPAAFVYFGNVVYGPGKAYLDTIVAGLRSGRARVIGPGRNRLPLTHVDDAANAVVHVAGLPSDRIIGRSFIAVPPTPVTQRAFLDLTADALGVRRPASAPTWLAALAAGTVNAELMTLDATVDPTALTATGFRFRYPDITDGITATLSAPAGLAA